MERNGIARCAQQVGIDYLCERHAEDLATDAGWLVSGPWEMTTDTYVAPITVAVGGEACGVIDPLGLERCAICENAFAYDADEQATYRWRRTGHRGFVCRYCAETVGRETPAEVTT